MAHDTDPTLSYFTSGILLPPFLTKAMVDIKAPTTAIAYVVILEACKKFDKNEYQDNNTITNTKRHCYTTDAMFLVFMLSKKGVSSYV